MTKKYITLIYDFLVLVQHAELNIYSADAWKLHSADRYVAPFGHIILIPSHPIFVFGLSP